MNIAKYKTHSKEKLIHKLKKVKLLNPSKTIYVYKNAKVDLKKVKIEDLLPLQLYELNSSSELIENLHKTFLKKYKTNIFEMKGFATYISDKKHFSFIPPVVEYIKNKDGKIQKIIIDGLHRILLAKKLKKKKITIVAIENIPQKLLFPAEPNKWEELKIVEKAPEGKDKRKWLIPPEKAYLCYRNFQSVFQNIGKPRSLRS